MSDIEGQAIAPQNTFRINSCGRENASSGTEGSFNLIDTSNGKVIRNVYWECPWGSKTNTFRVTIDNDDWLVEDKGANRDSGALGTVDVTSVRLA